MAVGLTIDSQSLDIDGAWEHDLSLGRLLGSIRTRGSNRLIPNVAGRVAYAPLYDEVTIDMQLVVYGTKDESGVAHADVFAGLADNLLYLRDWVISHTGTSASATYTASLEVPGGRTFSTGVQLLNWQVVRHEVTVAFVSYDLRIPSGTWTETTPP